MSDFMVLLLTTLAAYRVWRLLAEDSFPPSQWLADRLEQSTLRRFGPTWAAGVHCPWCSGAHISFLAVGLVWAFRPLPLPGLWFLAVSTLVGLIAQWDEA